MGAAPESLTAELNNLVTTAPEDLPDKLYLTSIGAVGLLRYAGTVENVSATFLLDSGASNMFVSRSFLKQHGMLDKITPLSGNRRQVRLANKMTTQAFGWVRMKIDLDGYSDVVTAVVMELHPGTDYILGLNWLKQYNPVVNWKDETLAFDTDGRQVQLASKRNERLTGASAVLDDDRWSFASYSQELHRRSANRLWPSLVTASCTMNFFTVGPITSQLS